ncbi:delta-1-pyrroline-5-carboxylate dehydrogenase, putative [Bodo saltans]|uniref:Delta-1-pyrroline-5-carboxylate dehydrogenase, putative n=1 Tax=Bodo saltans TaxID=75058 RepID=A0A0S4JRA8_BODSA|nr:delta-1-pyrroline-5-carboxylate dehydrogenase, putative [Bodo saltans]|eukprot:CUG92735.1 delta-1-pyrroline-5-carboxylate dehydrogenase, putative [Bodo saltans]
MGYIAKAKAEGGKVIAGGTGDNTEGYFIQPTIIVTSDPKSVTMREEIFGPVLTVFVYEDSKVSETLTLVDETTPYALTGGIFAADRAALRQIADHLRFSAGNIYINDKSTGAVVGQQPFGGGRLSGSNDKPGASQFLHRWISARTIKENFDLNGQVSYPHQLPDNIIVQ